MAGTGMTLQAVRHGPITEAPAPMLRGAARDGVVGLAGAAFAGVAGLGVTWLVARHLSTVDAGAFFSATATFLLAVAVARLGTQTSLVYWPSRLRARGERAALASCLRVGLTPVAVVGLAAGGALWLGATFARTSAYADQLRVLAVLVPAAALADAVLAATRGYRILRPTVVLDRLVRPGAQLAGLAALVLLHETDPHLVAMAWGAPYLPVAALAGYALARVHRAELGRVRRETVTAFGASGYWRYTAPRAVASTVQLAVSRLDVLLVAALAGLSTAAGYAVAGRFVALGQLTGQALGQAVQPRLAERLATNDTAGAAVLYRQATAWLMLLTWPLYCWVAGYPQLYLGVFGDRYRDGVRVVGVLASAMLVATGCGMVDMVLAMAGRTWWNLANVGTALGVLVVVDVALIPRLGALGAAVGLAAAVLVNNLVPLVQLRRTLGVHPFGRATVVAGALAAGCFAVPAVAVRVALGGAPTPGTVIVTTVAGTVAYLAAIAALRDLFTTDGGAS